MKEKLTKENVKKVLEEFISMPIDSSNNVLEKFSLLPNAIYHNDEYEKIKSLSDLQDSYMKGAKQIYSPQYNVEHDR